MTQDPSAGSPAPARRETEDDISDAVLAVPGVAGLHGGTFGEVASYLPGRKIVGVRRREDSTEVHVSLEYGVSVREVAEDVRRVVRAMVDLPVSVTVEDVVRP